jgi:WD40 repeat protein
MILGGVPNGLLVHPDRQHLIHALGSTVIIENLENKSQTCLSGHTDEVTCIAVSKSGRYLASGQKTHMGFKADIIVWDYEECKLYLRLTLHKVKVEALAFSPNDMYLVSLGGQDDGRLVTLFYKENKLS